MFTSKRRLRERLADEKARTAILREQLKDTAEERDSWKWAAENLDNSRDDLIIRRTRERDQAIRELERTRDDLAAARQRLADRTRPATQPARTEVAP